MDKNIFVITGAGDVIPGDLSSESVMRPRLPLTAEPLTACSRDADLSACRACREKNPGCPPAADSSADSPVYDESAVSRRPFLCAADAGFLALLRAGLKPDLVIGDFDSMPRPDADCEIIDLPVVKDDTDISFCIKEGFRRGYRRFLITGALGGSRISHSLANLQLLSMVRDMGGQANLIAGKTAAAVMKPGEVIAFPAGTEGLLSVFSLTEESVVSLDGLFYPLDHGSLQRSFPLGVSNHFIGEPAAVTLHEGELLVVLESGESV